MAFRPVRESVPPPPATELIFTNDVIGVAPSSTEPSKPVVAASGVRVTVSSDAERVSRFGTDAPPPSRPPVSAPSRSNTNVSPAEPPTRFSKLWNPKTPSIWPLSRSLMRNRVATSSPVIVSEPSPPIALSISVRFARSRFTEFSTVKLLKSRVSMAAPLPPFIVPVVTTPSENTKLSAPAPPARFSTLK